MKIEIEKAENGYVIKVEKSHGTEKRIFDDLHGTLQSLCEDALLHFEGRARTFTGERYGEIQLKIYYKPE